MKQLKIFLPFRRRATIFLGKLFEIIIHNAWNITLSQAVCLDLIFLLLGLIRNYNSACKNCEATNFIGTKITGQTRNSSDSLSVKLAKLVYFCYRPVIQNEGSFTA